MARGHCHTSAARKLAWKCWARVNDGQLLFCRVFFLVLCPWQGTVGAGISLGRWDHRGFLGQQGRTSQPALSHLPAKELHRVRGWRGSPLPGHSASPWGWANIYVGMMQLYIYMKHILHLEVTRLSFNTGV